MLEQVNKWVTIVGTVVLIVNNLSIITFFKYIISHYEYAFFLVLFSILSVIGQMFIYRLIKQFKQHIVPFVVSSRKVGTIMISILFLGHNYSYLEFIGILVIFSTVTYEFLSELKISNTKNEKF